MTGGGGEFRWLTVVTETPVDVLAQLFTIAIPVAVVQPPAADVGQRAWWALVIRLEGDQRDALAQAGQLEQAGADEGDVQIHEYADEAWQRIAALTSSDAAVLALERRIDRVGWRGRSG